MGQCYKCKQYFGPDWLVPDENKPIVTCAFCHTGKNSLEVTLDDNSKHRVTKQECINKYKEFIDRMVNSEEIKKKVITEQIKG